MKKILVSLLCVVMMVTFMPSMAFATEDILNDNLSTEVKPCVQIDHNSILLWKKQLMQLNLGIQ